MDSLTPQEIRELANLYTPDAARLLLETAGLSPARHPTRVQNTEEFWTAVSALVNDGIHPGLRSAILAEAARDYPVNPVLGDGRRTASAGGRRRPARARSAWARASAMSAVTTAGTPTAMVGSGRPAARAASTMVGTIDSASVRGPAR